jgi:hypothetical protein
LKMLKLPSVTLMEVRMDVLKWTSFLKWFYQLQITTLDIKLKIAVQKANLIKNVPKLLLNF